MNEMFWNVMVEELAGAKFTTYGLYQVAQSQIGEVVGSTVYDKLTQRLYEPTASERFAAA